VHRAILLYTNLTKNYFHFTNIISCSIAASVLRVVTVDTRDNTFISYSTNFVAEDIKPIAIDKLLLKDDYLPLAEK
jgi:hypothetical protein